VTYTDTDADKATDKDIETDVDTDTDTDTDLVSKTDTESYKHKRMDGVDGCGRHEQVWYTRAGVADKNT